MRADGAALGRIARRARVLEERYGRPVSQTLPAFSRRARELEEEYDKPIYQILLETVWVRYHGALPLAAKQLRVPAKTLGQWMVLVGLNRDYLARKQAFLELALLQVEEHHAETWSAEVVV